MKLMSSSFEQEPSAQHQADLLQAAASKAGQVLADRRKLAVKRHTPDTRKWTGRVFGRKRAWVGQPVVLPDESVGWIKKAQAGGVCVRTSKVDPEDGPIHHYMAVGSLRRYKVPEAVLLGQMKRGVKEAVSAIKAAASRSNGKLPPKPGSRPRGRPRTSKQAPSAMSIRTLLAELRSGLETAPPGS